MANSVDFNVTNQTLPSWLTFFDIGFVKIARMTLLDDSGLENKNESVKI